eukprot:CAMPEP_0204915234 /NCGR_PEP_ID=MMETSP1397-20131031/13267_1 /ASSEMBLY_ACC=CAM_ASM_000891 /TAXON_ID=49980 /ORGANISM="Climacostomum Climacostomum virens, Strain Stock W-24" /LENGTH=531 /DNA_ID=CAMNT_0052087177 /DNA_START=132 /DNA_END=1723 /DNA_ORIENTATION=-
MEWETAAELQFSKQYVGHFHWVNDLALDASRGKLFSASSDQSICIWPLDSAETEVFPLARWNRHTDYIQTLATASDFLFSGGQDGHLCRWSLIEERSETVLTMPGKSIWSLGIDATGQLIGLSFVNKIAKIYDLRTEGDMFELKGHSAFVRTIIIDSNGRLALTGSSDHQIKLWDLGMKRCIHTFDCHSDSVYSLHASPDFNKVLSGGRDGKVFESDLSTHTSTLKVDLEIPVLDACLYDNLVWTASTDSTVRAFDSSNREVAKITGRPTATAVARVDDMRHVLIQTSDNAVQVWDLMSGLLLETKPQCKMQDVQQDMKTGKALNAWFSTNIQTGSLIVELSGSEAAHCEEVTGGVKTNYGVSLIRDIFKPLLEKDYAIEVGTPLVPLQDSQRVFMNQHALIAVIKDEAIQDFCYIKDIAKTNLKIPAWVRTYAFKPKEAGVSRGYSSQVHFNLFPASGLPSLKSCKLQATSSVTVAQLITHIVKEISLPPDRLQMICKDHLLSLEATLGNLKTMLWKLDTEMNIEYRLST